MEKNKPKCIDLFSGCGGFTLGVAQAGFNVVGHVEWMKDCRETYEHNKEKGGFPNSELIGEDITKISDKTILKFKEKHNEINMIVGGPPCQSFSVAGKREVGDPRDNLFLHYMRFVKLIQPNMFMLENVPGMLSKKSPEGKLMIDIIRQGFEDLGYHIEISLLNAVNYLVPQNRKRVIIVGVKDKSILEKPVFPIPVTFGIEEGEGTSKVNGKPGVLSRCPKCNKFYASFVVDKQGKECLFCYYHRKNKNKTFNKPDLQVGWVAVPKEINVPATPEQFVYIRGEEIRKDLTGTSRFLYVESIGNGLKNTTWFNEHDLRKVEDEDTEIMNAEAFIFSKTFAEPLKKTMGE